MRFSRRTATVLTAAAAAVVLTAGTANAAGPTYSDQVGQTTVDHCINQTGGGTAGGAYVGQFQAYSQGGAGCNLAWVELVYVDASGNEQYIKQDSGTTVSGATTRIFLKRSQYQSILEVEGQSRSVQGDYSPVVRLWF